MKVEYEIDNRGLECTELHADKAYGIEVGSITMEVNPWELVENALANAGYPEGIGEFLEEYFSTSLEEEDDSVRENDTKRGRLEDLAMYITHTPATYW